MIDDDNKLIIETLNGKTESLGILVEKYQNNRFNLAFQKIQKAISELDDNYKSLILLKHYQELSYKEFSEILSLPISKEKSRLYSAREKLRISLVNLEK